VRAPVNFFEF